MTVFRLAARQRWQTKRGIPGRERIVDWITLDVDARFDEIGPRVARETDAGRVDLPEVRRVECRTALTVENRAWALIGGGARGDGRGGRVLLLRATHLPRPGGVR